MLRQQLTELEAENELSKNNKSNTNETLSQQEHVTVSISSLVDAEHGPTTGTNTQDSSLYGSLSSYHPKTTSPIVTSSSSSQINQSTSVGVGALYPNDESEEDDDDNSDLWDDSEDDDENEESSLLSSDSIYQTDCCLLQPCLPKGRRGKQNKIPKVFRPILSPLVKFYNVAKDALILITNVDDVWDSPALLDNSNHNIRRSNSVTSISSTSISHRSSSSTGGRLRLPRDDDHSNSTHNIRVSFSHKMGVLFWILVMSTSYGSERITYKILIDRTGPFRMVIGAEIVTAVHAIILGSSMLLRKIICKYEKRGLTMIPLLQIWVISIFDSIQLLLVVVSGSHVAPTLTAILVHFTIPLSTFFNQLRTTSTFFNKSIQSNEQLQPDDIADNNSHVSDSTLTRLSSRHIFGSTLILISSILALSPAIATLVYPSIFPAKNVMADITAWNTLLLAFSCIPGAISQIYKEHALSTFAQPVDSTYLDFLLSVFSFIFSFLISPLVYCLQGLAGTPTTPDAGQIKKVQTWINLYPTSQTSINFSDGLSCFLGRLDDNIQQTGYPEVAHCDYAYSIVLSHVMSVILIKVAVDKICNAGAFKIMHQSISAGIILSVVVMMYYQIFVDDIDYGILPNSWHITCAVVLVIGSEVYHRVTLEVPTFETVYPQVSNLFDYDDEEM